MESEVSKLLIGSVHIKTMHQQHLSNTSVFEGPLCIFLLQELLIEVYRSIGEPDSMYGCGGETMSSPLTRSVPPAEAFRCSRLLAAAHSFSRPLRFCPPGFQDPDLRARGSVGEGADLLRPPLQSA